MDYFLDSPYESKKIVRQLLPRLASDKKTVLVVAGDLGSGYSPTRVSIFLCLVAPHFKHVIYVLGNHEHYGTRYGEALVNIKKAFRSRCTDEHFNKVSIISDEVETLNIDGVTFICSTLWTDYGANLTQVETVRGIIEHGIADHRAIRNQDYDYMKPAEFAELHKTAVNKIEELLKNSESNDRTVVVTHHLPSFTAVHPRFMMDEKSRILNHAFTSSLDHLMVKYRPAIWIFGHTHSAYVGTVGDTKLLCNPYGYPHEPTARSGYYDTTRVITV